MPPQEDLLEGMRYLTWHQHQGSGTNLTLTEVENMDLKRFTSWVDWVTAQRNKEAAELRKANRGR